MPPPGSFQMTGAYKRICFTINLLDGETWEDFNIKNVRVRINPEFFIAGKETCPTTGRKHYQGFYESSKRKTAPAILQAFRAIFPEPRSIRLIVACGTAEQNIDYCSKEDKEPYVHGEPLQGQGARSDIQSALQDIKNGMEPVAFFEKHSKLSIQYQKGLNAYRNLVEPKRSEPTKLIFLWGPTGTGKTMHAQELSPVTVSWVSNQYLNGFNAGDKVLLFDDFDYRKMDWQTFLTMTDRYAMNINVKGGSLNFAPTTIIFTSNSDPKDWYPDVPPSTRQAIHRRMEEFGDIKYLGELVPKSTNLLEKYFSRPTGHSASATATAAGPSSFASAAYSTAIAEPNNQQEIIILDSDSEEDHQAQLRRKNASAGTSACAAGYNSDDNHSQFSNIARRQRRKLHNDCMQIIKKLDHSQSDQETEDLQIQDYESDSE